MLKSGTGTKVSYLLVQDLHLYDEAQLERGRIIEESLSRTVQGTSVYSNHQLLSNDHCHRKCHVFLHTPDPK